MGTHSLIIMRTKVNGEIIVYTVLYQQFDGYPQGVGKKLLEFLKGMTIVNGIPFGSTEKAVNGAGDLFAHLVYLFKKKGYYEEMATPDGAKIGGTYILPPSGFEHEEYNYIVTVENDKIKVSILEGDEPIDPNVEEASPEEWLRILKLDDGPDLSLPKKREIATVVFKDEQMYGVYTTKEGLMAMAKELHPKGNLDSIKNGKVKGVKIYMLAANEHV